MPKPITQNTLFYGDNLDILRDYIPTESVDLIYLDPPFNSSRTYNVLFKYESGEESEAQIAAFEDTWHWNRAAFDAYQELVTEAPERVSRMIEALHEFIGPSQMLAYLVMMTIRLVELHRVLKPTGSLYLHCDPTASHYLKVVLDTICGPENFRSEIIWQRTSSHNDSKKWGAVHDVIFYYGKSKRVTWNPIFIGYDQGYIDDFYRYEDERGVYRLDHIIRSSSMGPRPNLVYEHKGFIPEWGWRVTRDKLEALEADNRIARSKSGRPYLKRYLHEQKGVPAKDVITDIPPISAQSAEKLGYPTQKPLELLERIIEASSNPGDIVLDPFCGCGTTVVAAEKLGRKWVGIDITPLAIALQRYRLQDMFPEAQFQVIGQPTTVQGARELANEDRFKFQVWALSLISARPLGGQEGKKGADRGVDGLITFMDDHTGKAKRIVIQVKSGKVNSAVIRDLVGTVTREKATMGVLVTLENPTRDMVKEALSAGAYHSPGWNKAYPRIQILTIADLLKGAEVEMPPTAQTFKKAAREQKEQSQQPGLFD